MRSAEDIPDDADALADRAAAVLRRFAERGWRVATAESCTGGLLSALLTDIEGLGGCFERGFVTYTDEAKCELLGLQISFIARHGEVSREVAQAMAEGALARSNAQVAVAVTGFAGKAGPNDEVGLVHLAAVADGGRPILRECHFGDAGRDRVRALTAAAALEMLEQALAGTLAERG